MKLTHTPTPLGIREPFTSEEKKLNRIFITGKRTDDGRPTDEDFDFLELPYAPIGSPRRAMAEYVVRAVNAHEELLETLHAVLFQYGHTMSSNFADGIRQTIAKAEGKQ